MKTSHFFGSILAIAFLFGFTSNGIAGGIKPLATSIEQKTITISIYELKPKEVEVRILDKKGEVLLTELFNTKDFRNRKYNLNNLPDGKYDLEVSDVQKTITMTLIIKSDILEIEKEEKLYKPHSFIMDKKWNLSVMSLGKDVNVRIIDQRGELVYEDEIKEKISVNRRYNLSKLKKGSYNLYISIDGNSYDQGIIKI